ncbi:hypothetical protein ACTU6V_00075 [Microbacterium sp. A204]|uniref:hypothetical protein n=1 Tax=Microbacterium sp. A204 TaxID=3457321 RepID=UPI003FD491D1
MREPARHPDGRGFVAVFDLDTFGCDEIDDRPPALDVDVPCIELAWGITEHLQQSAASTSETRSPSASTTTLTSPLDKVVLPSASETRTSPGTSLVPIANGGTPSIVTGPEFAKNDSCAHRRDLTPTG